MHTQFIYIDDIAKFDTSKATVYDLNKRFIDSDGNMFGLKYNRDTKRIEVIRLVRTSMQHARLIAKKMTENKIASRPIQQKAEPTVPDYEEVSEEEFEAQQKEEIIPDYYVAEKFNELTHFKERLRGLIRNINSTNINSREHREVSTVIDEILRNLEMDGVQKIDKVMSLYRELTEYPRSINYYIGRIDTRGRNLLTEIGSDDKKMKYVLYSEILTSLRELYGAVDKILTGLSENIGHTSSEKVSKMNPAEKQHYRDAEITINNTRKEIKDYFDSLNDFENRIYDISLYR